MLNRTLPRYAAGFTIMELLVGMVLGLIVMGGAIVLFSSISSSTAVMLTTNKMQQELRTVGLVMTRDIRRAGFSGVVPGVDFDGDGLPNGSQTDGREIADSVRADILWNPFLAGTADIRVLNAAGTNDCILFTYNLDPELDPAVTAGNPAAIEDDEWYGYRRQVVGGRGVVQSKTAGVAPTSCNDIENDWETISADDINVTNLTFTMASAEIDLLTTDVTDVKSTCEIGEPCQCIRTVKVQMNVALVGDANVKSQMVDSVRVRNDKVVRGFAGNPGCFE